MVNIKNQTDLLALHRTSPRYNPSYRMEDSVDMARFARTAGNMLRLGAAGVAATIGANFIQDATDVSPAAAENPAHQVTNSVQPPLAPNSVVHVEVSQQGTKD